MSGQTAVAGPLKPYRPDPCPECPWRKAHPAGWLGGLDIEWFTGLARRQVPIACHKTCGGSGAPALCTGYAQHLNNSLSSPRDPEFAATVESMGENPEVFKWLHDFDNHHSAALSKVSSHDH